MDYLSLPQAIKKLFGVELSENKALKDLVYPLARFPKSSPAKNFLNVVREKIEYSDKYNILVPHASLIKLHNAMILQCIFADTKKVKDIFVERKKRTLAAEFIQMLLIDRQSVIGISLSADKSCRLVEILFSNNPLDEVKLPNPFEQLPILSGSSLVQGILVQSAAISQGEKMMMHYLNGDLELAYQTSLSIRSTNEVINKYQLLIASEYQEAVDFDHLLENI
ncbi:hypothetical protein [Parashewanella tropica]|uniref:hypothetical protein n=1 Tax=Parashewanella tropica TaxID=2547970 RepID=UPI00105A3A4A|nr:hypothetical protein [Parashewanella tropica]